MTGDLDCDQGTWVIIEPSISMVRTTLDHLYYVRRADMTASPVGNDIHVIMAA